MGESIPHCLYIHCCALSLHFPSSKCYISVAISDNNIYIAISHHNISVANPQHNFIRCKSATQIFCCKSATQIFCCTSATLRFCNTQLAHNGLCSSHMHYFPFTYLHLFVQVPRYRMTPPASVILTTHMTRDTFYDWTKNWMASMCFSSGWTS